jgi:hypothetical protein
VRHEVSFLYELFGREKSRTLRDIRIFTAEEGSVKLRFLTLGIAALSNRSAAAKLDVVW